MSDHQRDQRFNKQISPNIEKITGQYNRMDQVLQAHVNRHIRETISSFRNENLGTYLVRYTNMLTLCRGTNSTTSKNWGKSILYIL